MNFRSQILAPTVTGLDSLAATISTEINTLQTTAVDANGARGVNLFDATTGAASFSLVQNDPYKVATAGLLRVTPNPTNTGNAVLDYNQIAAGTATPSFTLIFTTAGGYAIDGTAIDVDGNGNFTHEGIDYSISGTSADGDSFVVGLNTNAAGDNRNIRLVAQLQFMFPNRGSLTESVSHSLTRSLTHSPTHRDWLWCDRRLRTGTAAWMSGLSQ